MSPVSIVHQPSSKNQYQTTTRFQTPNLFKMVKIASLVVALATLAAARPNSIFRRDCPELPELADQFGCDIWSLSECELCCPSNPGSSCHPGHDQNPCDPGHSQYHCDGH
ncbi:hypothetical protein HJFPF1_02671 [Paramyrothecium foliicola]|nr:hypothetical protein HJFPF1_02671 [Paramyrothecium foliicola]